MLRDSVKTYQAPKQSDFSADLNCEIDTILLFIDNNISSFIGYYLDFKDSENENRISDFLINHFELCKNESICEFPFRFGKNSTRPESNKETDIGVYTYSRKQKLLPIIEFEAKRLSESSNNKEYVCGKRGGIERFKRGHHSSHLKVCGMFGYVQSRNTAEWLEKINKWIADLSQNNSDSTIDWSDVKELLRVNMTFPFVEKFESKHQRISQNDSIILWHYLIDLTQSK